MKKILTAVIAFAASAQLFAVDYATLQTQVLTFYSYQRAGLSTGSCYNLNSGFTNASHNGDNYNGNLLDGGWYDAGDYIKFGMNLGYSAYCLLKGYDIFPSGYADNTSFSHGSADGIPDVLNEAKVATDWMIKAVINESTVVLDVGIAQDEHQTWGVVYASGRSGSQIGLCTGGDIPATYAACLALMSTLYRKYDATYADQCLAKAKVAFTFAKNKFASGNNYCTPQLKDSKALYDYPTVSSVKNQQINDRMVAAGIELYRATSNGDPIYRTWATKSITEFYNCMGYAFIGPLASFEVWRQGLGGPSALTTNVGFIDSKIVTASNQFKDVYQNSGWGTARDIGTAAMEYAMVYVTTASETQRTTYLTKLKNHVNWLIGSGTNNTQSYICGVGNGPTKIHYRTTNYGPVPGGIVSGPTGLTDTWSNDGTANHCEVAIDYNAGLVGALAFLKELESTSDTCVRISTAFSASPSTGVDFTSKSVTFTAGFSKSVTWTITINGSYGTKTLTGSGTSISATWDGTADKGGFLGGETVSAALVINKTISAIDLVKASALQIVIAKNKKESSISGDIVLDDFEDKDTVTKINSGKWRGFGTKTGFSATTVSAVTDSGSVALYVNGTADKNDNTVWAGAKATFNGDGTAASIGSIKSVAFDLRCKNKSIFVRVELEQSTITDNAYYGVVIPVTTVSNRYRVNIADFVQPDWKTSTTALDLNAISALRFTVYDSTGSVYLYLDNVAINGLSVGVKNLGSNFKQLATAFKPVVSQGTLAYCVPQDVKGQVTLAIFNIAGKEVLKRTVTADDAHAISVSLDHLPAGSYTVSNTVNGATIGKAMRFVLAK